MPGIENWLLFPILAITNSSIFCIYNTSSYCLWMSCYWDSYYSACVLISCCCNSYYSTCAWNRSCSTINNPFNVPISPNRVGACDSCNDGLVERLLDLCDSFLGTPQWPECSFFPIGRTYALSFDHCIEERDPLQSKGTGEYLVCDKDCILKI